ncbi:LytR C-terminal domain-containing protein [Alloscardovia venturai]|uniref:LytR C-terminal domain-containing protein n=1 Tax=Alloscardovia venturai TaxID=1769421 RepID=A0ABW2Y6B1_9BIFI
MTQSHARYPRDEFDNFVGQNGGAHRGKKTIVARILPYVVAIIVALACALLFWGWVSGSLGTSPVKSSTKQVASSATSSTTTKKSDSSSNSLASSSAQSKSSKTQSSTSTSSNSANSSNDQHDSSQSKEKENSEDNTKTAQASQINKATNIVVFNGNGTSGFAAQKRTVLANAGYTSVTATNPSNYSSLPASATVWYVNDSDAATAQDVAKTLGITAVEKVSALSQGSIAVIAK